ncbi:hypothetical protein AB2S62_13695 [Vibrio sp. NTOU-M3]|uniref:hypothetical protein n=1 Tax=Vibrio sp. NTOU-M3 TaxID=3234954 RepID=UPI00349F8123
MNFKNFIHRMFPGHKFSVETTAMISIIIFHFLSTIYSLFVFTQFNIGKILELSIVFLILFCSFILIFSPSSFKFYKNFNLISLFWAIITAIFLTALLNSPSLQFLGYFPTFPLTEAELGLGWSQDSVFHASIIQSFKNFGFPSIGQHDTPLLVYHVLSHFVDSILIQITDLDVWKSYGLMYFYKAILLISSIVFFIATSTKNHNRYSFILSVIFLTPIIISTWHAIGSHGLWFTSITLLFSAPYVFKIISIEREINLSDYFILFILAVIISLGKISSGFMFSMFIGFSLLILYYKDWKVYIFGISLLLFFSIYQSFLTVQSEVSLPNIMEFLSIISLKSNIIRHQLFQVYLILFALFTVSWVSSSKKSKPLVLSGIISVITISIIITIQPNLTTSDKGYFIYGLSSFLILISYQAIIRDISLIKENKSLNYIHFNYSHIQILLIISILLVTNFLDKTRYNAFNFGLNSTKEVVNNFYSLHFSRINRGDVNLNANIHKMLSNRNYIDFDKYERPLDQFNLALTQFMQTNKLTANNTLLYFPKEIFENEFNQFRGNKWARGMLVYAVTGVPLIHGIERLSNRYGYLDYDPNATWVPRNRFNHNYACQFKKNIVIIETMIDRKFNLVRCD